MPGGYPMPGAHEQDVVVLDVSVHDVPGGCDESDDRTAGRLRRASPIGCRLTREQGADLGESGLKSERTEELQCLSQHRLRVGIIEQP